MLSGPRGILFSSCHPVANICLSLVPLAQAPLKPGAAGTDGHPSPPPRLTQPTNMLTHTPAESDTHGSTRLTLQPHAAIHVYHCPHTQTPGPHLPVPSHSVKPRSEASGPCLSRPAIQENHLPTAQKALSAPSLSRSWGQRDGRGFPEGSLSGDLWGSLGISGSPRRGPTAHTPTDLAVGPLVLGGWGQWLSFPASRLQEQGTGCTGRAEGPEPTGER